MVELVYKRFCVHNSLQMSKLWYQTCLPKNLCNLFVRCGLKSCLSTWKPFGLRNESAKSRLTWTEGGIYPACGVAIQNAHDKQAQYNFFPFVQVSTTSILSYWFQAMRVRENLSWVCCEDRRESLRLFDGGQANARLVAVCYHFHFFNINRIVSIHNGSDFFGCKETFFGHNYLWIYQKSDVNPACLKISATCSALRPW